MPAWKADGTPTINPQAELSHIYYASRAGLEDRIVRIRSGNPPPSTPNAAHRSHPRQRPSCGVVRGPAEARFDLGEPRVLPAFGREPRVLRAARARAGAARGDWRIAKKKILLPQNDYIPTMLDVYCV